MLENIGSELTFMVWAILAFLGTFYMIFVIKETSFRIVSVSKVVSMDIKQDDGPNTSVNPINLDKQPPAETPSMMRVMLTHHEKQELYMPLEYRKNKE